LEELSTQGFADFSVFSDTHGRVLCEFFVFSQAVQSLTTACQGIQLFSEFFAVIRRELSRA
jgi:hypothetical protein